MKIIIYSLLVSLFLFPGLVSAQKNIRPYKAKLYMNNKTMRSGYLFDITHNQIMLVYQLNSADLRPDSIDITRVNKIVLRKKGKMGRAIAFVAIPASIGLGTVTGATNNFASDPSVVTTEGMSFLAGAITGAIIGTVVGVIIGLPNNGSYKINGEQPLFDKYYPEIRGKCYVKN